MNLIMYQFLKCNTKQKPDFITKCTNVKHNKVSLGGVKLKAQICVMLISTAMHVAKGQALLLNYCTL